MFAAFDVRLMELVLRLILVSPHWWSIRELLIDAMTGHMDSAGLRIKKPRFRVPNGELKARRNLVEGFHALQFKRFT